MHQIQLVRLASLRFLNPLHDVHAVRDLAKDDMLACATHASTYIHCSMPAYTSNAQHVFYAWRAATQAKLAQARDAISPSSQGVATVHRKNLRTQTQPGHFCTTNESQRMLLCGASGRSSELTVSRLCSGLRSPWTAHLLHRAQRQGAVRPAGCRAKGRTV